MTCGYTNAGIGKRNQLNFFSLSVTKCPTYDLKSRLAEQRWTCFFEDRQVAQASRFKSALVSQLWVYLLVCCLKCLFVLLIWSDNHTFEAFCETTKIALLSFSFQKTGHSNRTFGRFTHGVFGFIDNRLLQERFYDNSSESVSHLMCGLCLKSRMHWFFFHPTIWKRVQLIFFFFFFLQ